ncbi:class I SAM-dependent methyltransferase [Flavobacteriaceae bacterium]|nr:class I SAM-dependent methyltransferase [Flavobacteriaceae bacterium]
MLKSSNQHGIHSPFVYDLITKCFYDKTPFSAYHNLKALRNKLIYNQDLVKIKHYSETSKVFQSNHQKISTIVKGEGSSYKKQKQLYRITNYFKPKNVLELGTSVGLGSAAMAIASNNSIIKTVEVNKNISDIAKKVFKSYQLKNIQIDTSSFKDFFKKSNYENLDLVYLDGTCDKESTIENFNSLLKHSHNESVFIINNIYWSKEMTEAWNIIKKQKEITVSIDTFYWGFLFFRKEQPKQHFTIRL